MTDPLASAKRAAGRAAADLVEDGMTVGLGTGSTAMFVLERLHERCAHGLRIRGVPTSRATGEAARSLGVPLIGLEDVDRLDLAIDGADEVDPRKNLIKGGGGALLREKIVAAASAELVVVVDRSKLVERLGAFRVPVEVLPFGRRQAERALARLGAVVSLRRTPGGPFETDQGNHIVDCDFGLIADPEKLERNIDAIPGVVESGLFIGLAGRVFVGDRDGSVTRLL
jgi:ribose 5-phosphate isomerase A